MIGLSHPTSNYHSLSIREIQLWLQIHQKRIHFDESIPSITEIANRAGVSRQTIYALLRDERAEFGQVAQIRLSRAINQISSEPSYQHSKMARIDLSGSCPRIKFGV